MNQKSFFNKKIIILTVLLTVCIAAGTLSYLSSDMHHYKQAVQLMKQSNYEEALIILEERSDYKDASALIKESSYQIASKAYQKNDYAKAVEYFEKAEDFEDSYHFLNKSLYRLGHDTFLNADYELAEQYFGRIDNILDYGSYHFETYDQAKEYIIQQSLKAVDTIELYIADTGPEAEYGLKWQLLYLASAVDGYADWNPMTQKAVITPLYYPGTKIIACHRENQISQLTQQEKELYEKALDIVNTAKAETDSPIELEAWLNRWLSQNVIYQDEEESSSENELPRHWTAFGAIMDKKANCQGFTDAFYLLASLCDFNVRYQFGFGENAGHVWNVIELDGQWYYIDTTWNNNDGKLKDASYAYFNYVEGDIPEQQYYEFAKTADTASESNEQFDYYSLNNSMFETTQKAASYAISQKLKNRQNIVHLCVTKPDLTADDLINAMKKQLSEYGYNYTVYVTNRLEDTCYIVLWTSLYK